MADDLALFFKFTECDPEPVGGIHDGNRGLFATGSGEVRLKHERRQWQQHACPPQECPLRSWDSRESYLNLKLSGWWPRYTLCWRGCSHYATGWPTTLVRLPPKERIIRL